MDQKPARRHQALQDLSRHHHHALVTAQQLRHCKAETLQSVTVHLLQFWDGTGHQHFCEEEQVLLPAFASYGSVEDPRIVRMLLEHVKIRNSVSRARMSEWTVSDAISLGELLDGHVHLEERDIFPWMQDVFPDDVLTGLGPYLV